MGQPDYRTKFITTLGPASMNFETMRGLAQAGANVFRANFVHMQYDMFRQVKAWTEQINHELGCWVQIQADIQGPSIRLGALDENGFFLKEDELYAFIAGKDSKDGLAENELPINDATIHRFIQPNQHITFMNGSLEGRVTAVDGERITVQMINSGTLRSRKSINLPETELSTSLTEKDRRDLEFLMEAGIDWIAISFVSRASHVHELRQLIGDRPTKITSKIERRSALQNIEEIIEASDAIMVARGDLGIEIPMEEVPIVQRQIIEAAHRNKKPAIVATQMMLSLAHSLHPTRAEVSDVAHAVTQRADAVMMSEETAEGIDPVNALSQMVRVVARMEHYLYDEPNYFERFWQPS